MLLLIGKLAVVMFIGFGWYGNTLLRYKNQPTGLKVVDAIFLAIFGAVDIAWNLTAGTLCYWTVPFEKTSAATKWYHRQWTFSQRTEFWANESHNDWRRTWLLGGNNWKALLNYIVPGHIL